jgi:hypothetical protein
MTAVSSFVAIAPAITLLWHPTRLASHVVLVLVEHTNAAIVLLGLRGRPR